MVRKFIYYLFRNNVVGSTARTKIENYLPNTKHFSMVTKLIIKPNFIQTISIVFISEILDTKLVDDTAHCSDNPTSRVREKPSYKINMIIKWHENRLQ